MTIELNHTIVPARDKEESVRFYERMFGFKYEGPMGHFAPIKIPSQSLSLDFDNRESFQPQHYAFKVSEAEFDEIFGRSSSEVGGPGTDLESRAVAPSGLKRLLHEIGFPTLGEEPLSLRLRKVPGAHHGERNGVGFLQESKLGPAACLADQHPRSVKPSSIQRPEMYPSCTAAVRSCDANVSSTTRRHREVAYLRDLLLRPAPPPG